TAEVLEVMLFLMGIACIILEILVIPGFGIFGLGGGAMVLASLVLASQTFVLPTNDYQWRAFSQSMTTVLLAGVGVFAMLFLLRQNIHRAPLLRRVVLMPPSDDERELRLQRESGTHYEWLLGQIGVTRTQLMPSGKATFGDLTVDVMSEGELIDRGARVVVVEAKGNRVIVRASKGLV
ncbi:MAG: hypothetical protein KDA92_25820, partial [Planctomycetales bacterium]|nr:hypothetical protein [Planctomycetales bacterium]